MTVCERLIRDLRPFGEVGALEGSPPRFNSTFPAALLTYRLTSRCVSLMSGRGKTTSSFLPSRLSRPARSQRGSAATEGNKKMGDKKMGE